MSGTPGPRASGTRLLVTCPGCRNEVVLHRAARSVDPGLAQTPWVLPLHTVRGARWTSKSNVALCPVRGLRYARHTPGVAEVPK